MGLHVGDRIEDVLENRKRYFHALGMDENRLINCSQVHGTHIERVSEKDCGRGAFSLDTAIPDTDGLVTEDPQVPLTMNYADCTPLFFYDPLKKVAALSHGGWRGTAGNIVGKTVDLMVREYRWYNYKEGQDRGVYWNYELTDKLKFSHNYVHTKNTATLSDDSYNIMDP